MEELATEPILAVYEHGVLRPLQPLSLPEHTRVHIRIVPPLVDDQGLKQQVRQALVSARVIQPRVASPPLPKVTETDLIAAADALATAGPLSELIIEEREGR